jgi:hypothetical protein
MPKRCPPGVICIENMTIIFLISIFAVIFLYYIYLYGVPRRIQKEEGRPIVIEREVVEQPFRRRVFSPPLNVLGNPFTPPLRDSGWFPPDVGFPRGIPINTRTRGYDDYYRQVGILTRINGTETILPLMGRPLHFNQNKWQFYTISDNNVKLPVSKNGRSCTSEYGCDDLYNGDSVYIEGYNDAFKVTIYDNAQPRYIPFL